MNENIDGMFYMLKNSLKFFSFTNSEEKFKRMSVYVVKSGNLSNIYLNEVLYIH